MPDLNAGVSSAPVISHFGRLRLGEIYKIRNNLFEFVCLHCSQGFQNFSDFTSHAHEHLNGILLISTVGPSDASMQENVYQIEDVHNLGETVDMFDEADIDYNDRASDFDLSMDASEEEEAHVQRPNKKSLHGIDDQIKRRLAEENFTIDDSPEANEYSKYIYDYKFSKINGFYKCSKCKYKSGSNRHVRRHIFSHLKRQIFKCTICKLKASSLIRVREHKNFHQRQRNKSNNSNENGKAHRAPPQLDTASNGSDENSNQNEEMNNTIETNDIFAGIDVNYCSDHVSDSEDFENEAAESGNHESMSQSDCGIDSIDDSIRKRLAKTNFELDDSREAQNYSKYIYDFQFNKVKGLYKCPQCKYTSDQNRYVRRHIFSHLKRKIFKCTICKLEFSSIVSIGEHCTFHKRHKERNISNKSNENNVSYDPPRAKRMTSQANEPNASTTNVLQNEKESSTEPNDIFTGIDMDYCYDTASDSEKSVSDDDEREDRINLENKSHRGIQDDIRSELARKHFEIDDSPEAEEYARYLCDHRFGKINGLYKCPKCKYDSPSNRLIKRHIFSHLDRKIFKCTLCDMKFSRIYKVNAHNGLHRRQNGNKKKSKNKDHTSNQPIDNMNSKTTSTSDQFRDMESMLAKNGIGIKDTPEAAEYLQYLCSKKSFVKRDGKYHCSKCHYSSGHPNHVKRHFSVHLTEKIFTCLKCDLQIGNIPDSRKHMNLMHGGCIDRIAFTASEIEVEGAEPVAPPPNYDESSQSPDTFSSQIDVGNKSACCDICKKMVDEKYIERHMRVHSNEKKTECDECGATFKDPKQLTKHITVHMNVKDLYEKFAKRNSRVNES